MAANLKKNDFLSNAKKSDATGTTENNSINQMVFNAALNDHKLDLRQAMRLTAGAVAIITTGTGDNKTGATVTSANSFSIEPEEMMVAINRHSTTWQLIEKYKAFCVNYLDKQHVFLAEQFSGKNGCNGSARYEGANWQELVSGAPVLSDAIVAIDCMVSDVLIRNSHALIFGRVKSILTTKGSPLLFHNGIYVNL